ncbi:MAG TPA: PAS domain S-box protein [Candidatus Competibacteraceae bacterium]|nr:PAS domain S-box protein [Candidatus Competibacteraceae bacterium]
MTDPAPGFAGALDEAAPEILVVDDMPANLKLLVNLLVEQGYRVRPASSGALALRSVAAHAPDLILLDVRMPGLDGYAVCQRLKADPHTHAIPVIFISALNEAAGKIRSFAVGGVDYITKPFEPAEVLARVRTHLELRRLQRCLEQAQIELEQRVKARTAELVKANLALCDERDFNRTLIQTSPMFFVAIGADGKTRMMNEFMLGALGYAAEEVVGTDYLQIFVPEREHRILTQVFDQIVSLKQPLKSENHILTKDGQERLVEWRGCPVFKNQAFDYFFGVGIDITERKQAEEALIKSESLLNETQHLTQAGGWEYDLVSKKLAWTNEVYRIHGLTPAEYDPNDVQQNIAFYAAGDAAIIGQAFKRAVEEGEPYDLELRFRSAQGDEKWVRTIGKTEYQDGKIVRVFGNIVDITERKRAEEELQRHREHLEELVAERTAALQRANEDLRQAMTQLVQSEKLAALGQLVAGVAHELNTPLGNARVVASTFGEHLRVFTAAVESGALRRSQVEAFLQQGQEAVDLLERNTARAADLIGHFKQVAVDQTSMRRRRFNLRQTIEEVLVTLQPQFKHTTHRIEQDIPGDLELDSYPGPLEQVIANLIGNSLIHGFSGMEAGVIRIHAMACGAAYIQLDYTDDGAGIPELILDRIFEPFFTTKIGSGGSGLGLYIVYNLVIGILGGTIKGFNRAGKGVAFTLVLPQTAPEKATLGALI